MNQHNFIIHYLILILEIVSDCKFNCFVYYLIMKFIRYCLALQVAGSFVIGFLSFLIISSGLVIFGISQEVRGWLLPWLMLWMIFMVCQLLFGVRLLYRYYVFVCVYQLTYIFILYIFSFKY